jgi:hypothetical protein
MRGLALLLCVIQIMLLAQTPERSGHWREFTQPTLVSLNSFRDLSPWPVPRGEPY